MLPARKEAVQTGRTLVSDAPAAIRLAPVGVSTERVDPSTLQVIATLFPTARGGVDFLTRLLHLATVNQGTAAGAPQATVAEIRIVSIRSLAACIGRSYETTEKYVRLFCALNLLTKSRENRLVVLRFALGRYLPPASLSQMNLLTMEARPKVARFAKQVKRRFLRLYGDAANEKPIKARPASGTPAAEVQEAIQTLQEIMALPEAQAVQERLAVLESRLRGIDGRLDPARAGSHARTGEKQSRLGPDRAADRPGSKTAGSATENREQQSMLSPEAAGSTASAGEGQSIPSSDMAGSPAENPGQQSMLSPEAAGSTASVDKGGSMLSPERAGLTADADEEQSRPGPDMAGSPAENPEQQSMLSPERAGCGEHSHVNVCIKTITEHINVNVGPVSAYLRERFGESNHGFYHKLQKICARPEIWLAAALEVFVAMQRPANPPHHPGKYFFSRVCDMHQHGISPIAQDLIARYGDLSYAQLVETLHASASKPGQTPRPRPRSAGQAPFELRLERNREICGMPQEDLDALQQAISEQVEWSGWISRRYRQADGSCALLVESSLRRQIWLYSREHWRQRLMTLLPAPQQADLRPS